MMDRSEENEATLITPEGIPSSDLVGARTLSGEAADVSSAAMSADGNSDKSGIVDAAQSRENVILEGEDDGAAGAAANPLHEVESLCMRCEENGLTRLLLTRVPHFRDIVVMAFECPHCGERNSEIQFTGQLQPHGCRFKLAVGGEGYERDLDRQVVKSDSATITVPELEFEIPPDSQKGSLSTVEGILRRAGDGLRESQEERRTSNPAIADAMDAFLLKLYECLDGKRPFTLIVDDPAGNSFIESLSAPAKDPSLSVTFYERSREQIQSLGYLTEDSPAGDGDDASAHHRETDQLPPIAVGEAKGGVAAFKTTGSKYMPAGTIRPHGSVGAVAASRAIAQGNSEEVAAAICKYSAPEEVMVFPSTCGACAVPCETRMFVTNIPYFKEVIVMASTCDSCGYKNSELKPGGAVPEKGRTIKVRVEKEEDLKRDVIKSDTASVNIPELELELAAGTLGGLVTTVEGLITQIAEALKRVHGFSFGDSAQEWQKQTWQDFGKRLQDLVSLKLAPWTLILEDGLGNSFVAPVTDVMADDLRLVVEEFERTVEQNEELGLNDMDTSSADNAYDTQQKS